MQLYQKYKPQLKNIRRKLVLLLLFPPLLLLILIFQLMPIAPVRRFADFVGKQFYRMANKNREWALSNLERVYGDTLTEKEIEQLAQKSFQSSIRGFFDYMAYSHVRKPEKYFKLIEVEGEEHLRTAYERGKGVICLMPHMSSWEFAAITPPMLGYSTTAASKSMKMALLEKLMIHLRGSRGMKNITREGSYEALVDVLNSGECLILMTDQDTNVRGVFTDFLGHPAYTPLGASRLLLDSEAALVPMAMVRKESGDYLFRILPEIESVRTGNREEDLQKNTENQNAFYTKIIHEYPEQWVWMHRRWKTTPEILAERLRKRAEAKMKPK